MRKSVGVIALKHNWSTRKHNSLVSKCFNQYVNSNKLVVTNFNTFNTKLKIYLQIYKPNVSIFVSTTKTCAGIYNQQVPPILVEMKLNILIL